MKRKVVAVIVAFASFAAYGAGGTQSSSNNPQQPQQTSQVQNGQPQTAIPLDKTKPTSNEGVQSNNHVDPWSLLNQGWKQFEQTGK